MDDRLVELEERFLFLERHVEELDSAVRTLGDHVSALRAEVERQRELLSRPRPEPEASDPKKGAGPEDRQLPPPA